MQEKMSREELTMVKKFLILSSDKMSERLDDEDLEPMEKYLMMAVHDFLLETAEEAQSYLDSMERQ